MRKQSYRFIYCSGVLLLLNLFLSLSSSAQQWSGNNNTTDTILRTGDVGVGASVSNLISINSEYVRHRWYLDSANNYRFFLSANVGNFFQGPFIGNEAGGIRFCDSEGDCATATGSNTGSLLLQLQGGNVGIGTTNPAANLTVVGSVKNQLSGGNYSGITINPAIDAPNIALHGSDDIVRFRINSTLSIHPVEDLLRFQTFSSGDILALTGSGNIGIGTITPAHRLDVNGTARAEEIIVQTSGADFVFEDDYDLRSLEELERYIQEHGHLPEIPSAEQLRDEGMQVGDMQTKLLQKIEELTLYMIDMNKENEALREEVHLLKSRIQ
jgi:hypothetical protein